MHKHPTRRRHPSSPVQAFLNQSRRERLRRMDIEQEIAILNRDDLIGLLTLRDGYHCCCCGITRGLTLDHIIPLSLGGKTVLGNLQFLCFPCNLNKSNWIIDYRKAKV